MQPRVLLGFALFVLALAIPVTLGQSADPEPEEPLVCAYSTALGFNPWERFHVVGLDSTSQLDSSVEVQGRILAANLLVSGGCRINSNPGKTDQHKFAITAAGPVDVGYSTSSSIYIHNGGVDAYGDVTFGGGSTLDGDVHSQGTVTIEQSGRITGNVNAVGTVLLGGGGQVNGNVHTNGDATVTAGVKVSGNLIAGGSLVLNNGAIILGSAAAANDDGYDMSSATLTGALTVTATPPAMTIPFSTDFAAAKTYFEGRSAAWKEEADSIVNTRVVEAPNGFAEKRALHIRLHSKVNFYTVTREVLSYVHQIVLAGHPGGFLILNVPGTANFDLQYKRVFSSDKDGVESIPTFGRLLLNFYETTGKISIGNIHNCQCSQSGISIYNPAAMSILAPFAQVVMSSGSAPGTSGPTAYFKGNIIAKSFALGSGSIIYPQPFGTPVRPLVPVPRPPAVPSVNSGKMEFLCMWHNL